MLNDAMPLSWAHMGSLGLNWAHIGSHWPILAQDVGLFAYYLHVYILDSPFGYMLGSTRVPLCVSVSIFSHKSSAQP